MHLECHNRVEIIHNTANLKNDIHPYLQNVPLHGHVELREVDPDVHGG